MKFGKRMIEEMLPEWAEHYICYKRFKQLVGNPEITDSEFPAEFFRVLREELERAESHAVQMVDELRIRFEELTAETANGDFHAAVSRTRAGSPSLFPKRVKRVKVKDDGNLSNSITDDSVHTSSQDQMPSTYMSVDEMDEEVVEPPKSLWQRIPFLSAAPKVDAQEASRRRFVEWFSSATRLEHFCALNIEAVHKAAKKVAKNRPEVGDCSLRIQAELLSSRLTAASPKIYGMIGVAKTTFTKRFNEPLEQYQDVTMTEVWQCKWRFLFLGAALYFLARAMPVFIDHAPAHHCFALFVVVISLWVTEAIPFFCTAMLIPLIAVPTGILQDPVSGGVADPSVAAKAILGRVFDHVQILVLGGLTIAKAMSRAKLEVSIAAFIHRHSAHSPKAYMLGVMFLGCFLSIFVSNVASPLLVLSVIHPTLWEFPSDTNAPRGILLGLAFACNVGGMLSPISSPQNAVAMQVLAFSDISFAKWVLLALPLGIMAVVFAWAVLLWVWKPFAEVEYIPLQSSGGHTSGPPAPRMHVYTVIGVSAVTIFLWCLPPTIFFGDTGIIALMPIVAFFGSGILKKEDFNSLSWHLMFLLAGGNMLGLCARDSKMLDLVAAMLREHLEAQPAYVSLATIMLIVVLVTTFVSHTVAAMIMLPMIAKIGMLLPAVSSHPLLAVTPQLLVFLSTMMCSAAMAFPISSFPNVNSLLAEDESGRPYLRAKDFLFSGMVVTVFLVVCCLTWMIPYFNIVIDAQ